MAPPESGPETEFQRGPSLIRPSPNAGAAAPSGVKNSSVPAVPKPSWQSVSGHFSLQARTPSLAPAPFLFSHSLEEPTRRLTKVFPRIAMVG